MASPEDVEVRIQSQIDSEVEKPNRDKMSLSEWLRYMFFSVVFVIFVLNQLQIDQTYQIERGIARDLLSDDAFDKIFNATDVVDWIEFYFVPKLLELEYYPHNVALYNSTQARVAWFNVLTTPIRLVQKRVKLKENESDRNNEYVKYAWDVLTFDIYESGARGEMTDDYGPVDLYRFNSKIGIDDSGGYQQLIDPTANEDNLRTFEMAVDFLTENNWIDRQTIAIYIDFSTYNGHIGMLSYVNILVKISAAGSVEKSLTTTSMNVEPYSSGSDIIRAVLEVIFVLLSLLYAAMEVYKIKLEIAAKRMEHLEEGSPLNAGVLKMLWEGIKTHFSHFWNWMDFACILLNFIIIGLWIQYISSPLIRDGPGSDLLDQLVTMKAIYSQYISACSFNFLLIFIRMLKYLNRFERVALLQATFESAKDDILYFFVLLITVFLAFVIFGHIAFGSTHENFSTMNQSILGCFFLIFGDLSMWFDIRATHPVEATFFFFLFTFLIIFILLNMFVAILNSSYNNNFDKLEASKHKQQQDEVHPLLQVWYRLKQLCRNMSDLCNKDRRTAKKYAGAEVSLNTVKDEMQTRFTEYNINYKTSIKHQEYIDTEVLTDKEVLSKLAEITQSRRIELRAALIFLSFAVIYAVTLIEQIQVGTKNMLVSSVKRAIEDVDYTYQDGNYNINDMFNYETFFLWSKQLPMLFDTKADGSKFVLDSYLVGHNMTTNLTSYDKGPIRMTLRRVDMESNPSHNYDEYQEQIREGEITYFGISGVEDKTTFKGGATNFEYKANRSKSFMDLGGFLMYLSSDYEEFSQQLEAMRSDLILNDTSCSVVYDFVLYNGNVNHIIFTAIAFDFSSGGSINTSLYIWPMELQLYTTPGQIVRAIFETIYLMLLVYHIVETIVKLKVNSDSYTIWQRRLFEVLTEEQKRKRQRNQPEWIRRFFALVDVYLFIDLLAYILAILSIAAWITYLTHTNYGPELPEDDVDYFDSSDSLARAFKYYLDLSSLNLLLIFLRLLKFMEMSRSLSFLQNTISAALVDIYFFILMIVTFMLGFVFMSYLAFGTHAESFSEISRALITCFEMLIGELNYDEMSAANPNIAPIFFIAYLLLFVFVLLNIFIAILERAYSRVKVLNEEERSSPVKFIRVLIEFCIKRLRNNQDAREHEDNINAPAVLPEEVFVKMDIGLDGETDVESWAMRFAEHILMEKSKRAQAKSRLDILYKRRKAKDGEGKGHLISTTARTAEKRARQQFWNYLRIGFQRLKTQEIQIQRETKRAIDESMQMYQENMKLNKQNEDSLDHILTLEADLASASSELTDLRKEVEKNKP
jgi:hypothetical protein